MSAVEPSTGITSGQPLETQGTAVLESTSATSTAFFFDVAPGQSQLTNSEAGSVDFQEPARLPTASEWADLLGDDRAPASNTQISSDTRPSVLSAVSIHDVQGGSMDTDANLPTSAAGDADPSSMCYSCDRSGHRTENCPSNICPFCSIWGHGRFNCPTRKRCTKCRQLGHTVQACTSKLVMAEGEVDECAYCRSSLHLEDDCDLLWRTSYDPDKLINGLPDPNDPTRKKVRWLYVSCSLCGSDKHFNGDCPKNVDGPGQSIPSWSRSTWQHLIDPNSDRIPISARPGQASPHADSGRPAGKMRGKGPNVHIVYEDSDSDGPSGGFPVPGLRKDQPKKATGQIRMSSNIQFSGQHVLSSSLPQWPDAPETGPRSGPLKGPKGKSKRGGLASYSERGSNENNLPQKSQANASFVPPLPPGPPPGPPTLQLPKKPVAGRGGRQGQPTPTRGGFGGGQPRGSFNNVPPPQSYQQDAARPGRDGTHQSNKKRRGAGGQNNAGMEGRRGGGGGGRGGRGGFTNRGGKFAQRGRK